MFQSVWIWDAFALIGHACVWPDNKALFFWPPTRFQSAWIWGGLRSDWPQLPGEGGAASAHLAGPAHWPGWLCCDLATKCCCFSDQHPSGSSLCGYVEPLLSSAATVFDQTTKHCYHLPGSSLCGYREQSIVIICQVPVCVDTGSKALLLSARFQSVWIQGTKHCYCLPGSSLCGYREQSIVIVYQVPVCVDMGSLCSDWQLTVLTWQQSAIVFLIMHHVSVFVDMGRICPNPPQLCFDLTTKHCRFSDHSPKFQSLWMLGAFVIICRSDNKALFFWSPTRFQSVWIWGAFALIGHACVWPDNKSIVFLITHQVPVCVDMGGLCSDWPCLCLTWQQKHCFSDHPPGSSLCGYGGPLLWLAMPVFDLTTKALFFWSPTRFQSVWIWGAFALIGHACVWPDNKSIVFLITHQVPVCVDMGGLCSDWPRLPGEGGAASAHLAGPAHLSGWLCCDLATKCCCFSDHPSGSSLCGYREQSIVIVCQVPVCVDTGNKVLLLSTRFQSVWIQGTKYCYCPSGSSLCGYVEPLLSSAATVFDQTTKHCYHLPGSSLCGYREQSIVIVCQVPVCVDMGSLCSDWQLTVLTWQQSVIVFWSFTKVPVFVDVRSVCPHLPFWQ